MASLEELLEVTSREIMEMNPPSTKVTPLDTGTEVPTTYVRTGNERIVLTLKGIGSDKVEVVGTAITSLDSDACYAIGNGASTSLGQRQLETSIMNAVEKEPLGLSEVIPHGFDMVQTTWALRSMIEDWHDIEGLVIKVAPGLSIDIGSRELPQTYMNGQNLAAMSFNILLVWSGVGAASPGSVTLDSEGSYCAMDLLNLVAFYSTSATVHKYQNCESCNNPIRSAYERAISTVTKENILAVIVMREFNRCTSCAISTMKAAESAEEYERGGAVPNL